MPTLTLTEEQVRIILKSLAVCEGDMDEAREECRSDATRAYYTRKAEEYRTVWNAVYAQTTDDAHYRDTDHTISRAEGTLDRVPTV